MFRRIFPVLMIALVTSCESKNSGKVEDKADSQNAESFELVKKVEALDLSVEGAQIALLKNNANADSLIKAEIYGETGQSEYEFYFNGKLNQAKEKRFRYRQHLNENSNPELIPDGEQTLETSKESAEELTALYKTCRDKLGI